MPTSSGESCAQAKAEPRGQRRAPSRTAWWLGLLLPLALGAVLLSLDIQRPWTGSYDANGALFSTVARNYLRHGLAATRGGQVVNAGQLEPHRFRFYAHHPPGLPLAMAASFALFGVHEWSARLVPVLCTLGAAALLTLVACELGGPWAGFFAALVFVTQPMVAFYGRMPDHEAPGALFALALALCYLRWHKSRGKMWLAAMSLAAFLGVWFSWVVFVVPWLLLAIGWLLKGRRARGLMVPAVASALALGAVLAHVAVIEGGLDELWRALTHRLGSEASDRGAAGSFGLREFARTQAAYFDTGFSMAALAAALAWGAGLGRTQRASPRSTMLVAALAAFSLFNILGFKQGAHVHIYYQFYLAIPMALAAGLALDGLVTRSTRGRPLAAAAFLVAAVVAGEGWVKLGRIRGEPIPRYDEQLPVAKDIRKQAEPTERVLVVWGTRSSFRQLTYYADRDITVVPDLETARRMHREEQFSMLARVEGGSGKVSFVRFRGPRSGLLRLPSR